MSELPALGLPGWLGQWAAAPPPDPDLNHIIHIVAYGLVRSIPMLDVTMQSIEDFAPVNASFEVSAYCSEALLARARARINATAIMVLKVSLLTSATPHYGPRACDNPQAEREHQNELQANMLLTHSWGNVDTVVFWRLDTQLLSPIDAANFRPWRHPWRLYVPYLQSGAQINDRFLYGHPRAMKALQKERVARLGLACKYGEGLLLDLVRDLNFTLSFSRTRIIRRRADLYVPQIDAIASLGSQWDTARGWMLQMNTLPGNLICSHDLNEKSSPVCVVRPRM